MAKLNSLSVELRPMLVLVLCVCALLSQITASFIGVFLLLVCSLANQGRFSLIILAITEKKLKAGKMLRIVGTNRSQIQIWELPEDSLALGRLN